MKTIKLLTVLLLASVISIQAGKKDNTIKVYKKLSQTPFAVGENISYRIHYGLMNAGTANIQVKGIKKIRGKDTYHMVGTGKSAGMVHWLFPTNDRYETFMDTHTLEPIKFIRDVDENGFIIKRNINFNRENETAVDLYLKKDTVFKMPSNVQDIFSAFYFARSLDVTDIVKGDIIQIPVFLDHEMFPFTIKFMGREMVKTDFGKIACLKFVPVVQEGRVFKDEDDLFLWISDDINHVPIRIQSELLVGSIKADITEFKGLKTPLVFK